MQDDKWDERGNSQDSSAMELVSSINKLYLFKFKTRVLWLLLKTQVRKVAPLSPLLFNIVGDVLTRTLKKASEKGYIKGILETLMSEGIMALQYIDNTLLFSSWGREVRNLNIVLMLFEKVYGMRINFNKSEFIPMNLETDRVHEVAHVLNCPLGSLPFKYLGIPIHFEKLKRDDLQPVIDKLIKRVADWRGRLLAYNSRLVLIKTCLASIPVYLLSFIKFPN
jgi:hypothetical protein